MVILLGRCRVCQVAGEENVIVVGGWLSEIGYLSFYQQPSNRILIWLVLQAGNRRVQAGRQAAKVQMAHLINHNLISR